MEWMLQVADEVDDAVGLLKFGGSMLIAEIGVLLVAGFSLVVWMAGPSLGAEPMLLGAAALIANLAALLKARTDRTR